MSDAKRIWLGLLLCSSCSLDASPSRRAQTSSSVAPSDAAPDWVPESTFEPRVRITSTIMSDVGPSSSSVATEAKSEDSSKGAPEHDEPSTDSSAGADAAVSGGAAGSTAQPQGAGSHGSATPAEGGATAAGIAGTGGAQMQMDPGAGMNTPDGSQPTAGASDSGAGGDVSVDAGMGNLREALVDAAIEIFRARGRTDSPDWDRWRDDASDGGSLSPEFVLSILNAMRTTAVCFEEPRRCVQACLVIAQDCKPCAADAECAEALADVCGEQIARCP